MVSYETYVPLSKACMKLFPWFIVVFSISNRINKINSGWLTDTMHYPLVYISITSNMFSLTE